MEGEGAGAGDGSQGGVAPVHGAGGEGELREAVGQVVVRAVVHTDRPERERREQAANGVRNATQGEAWVDDVQRALKGMLDPEAAVKTDGVEESAEVKQLRERMVESAKVKGAAATT